MNDGSGGSLSIEELARIRSLLEHIKQQNEGRKRTILTADDVPIGKAKVFVNGRQIHNVSSVDPISGVVDYLQSDEGGFLRNDLGECLHAKTKGSNLRLEFSYDE